MSAASRLCAVTAAFLMLGALIIASRAPARGEESPPSAEAVPTLPDAKPAQPQPPDASGSIQVPAAMEFSLRLKAEDIVKILVSLQTRPYGEVSTLITSIQVQLNDQVTAQHKAAPPAAAKKPPHAPAKKP